MRILVIILYLIICNTAQAKYDILQSRPLFKQPLAMPRASNSGLTLNTSEYKGVRIVYIEGIIGKELPVVTWHYDSFSWQVGIEATAWITLGVPAEDLSFPLLTQDFHFAIPASIKYNNLSASIKFNHISAHQGDGFDNIMLAVLSESEKRAFERAERLGSINGLDVSFTEPLVYSRDYISAHIRYDILIRNVDIGPYFHIGYVHKMIPSELDKWFFGNGVDIFIKTSSWLTPFYAQDVTWNADTNSVDLSIKAGILLFENKANISNVGITFNVFIGRDRRGQLLNRAQMKEFGMGVFIR